MLQMVFELNPEFPLVQVGSLPSVLVTTTYIVLRVVTLSLQNIGNGDSDKAAYLLSYRPHATGKGCSLEARSNRSAVHLVYIGTNRPTFFLYQYLLGY